MSQIWQKALTAGIFVAVFVVRFISKQLLLWWLRAVTDLWMLSIWRHINPLSTARSYTRRSPMIDAFACVRHDWLSYFIGLQQAWSTGWHVEPIFKWRLGDLRILCVYTLMWRLFCILRSRRRVNLVLISAVLGIVLHIGSNYLGHFA